MSITYGAVSERGDVREENQDCVLCQAGEVGGRETGLFVVADGMGGLSHGARVSRYIAEQFAQWRREDFLQMVLAGKTEETDLRELLEQELWDINQAVLDFRKREGCRAGSTLSVLLLYGGNYHLLNLGDSRIYLLRDGVLRRLTEDQSVAAQMVREGKMTEEEARHFKGKNVLTMCVGMFEIPHSFYAFGDVRPGDLFLLCSDGLYNCVEQERMREILSEQSVKAEDKALCLRSQIPPGFASDNVSAVVVETRDWSKKALAGQKT